MMVRKRMVLEAEEIEASVAKMAAHAKLMLQDGVRSMDGLDKSLAAEVVAKENVLAQWDADIEAAILTFLSLQAPVAKDLRRMGAALKLITYLNRIGRYGYDVAHVAEDWPEDHPHVARLVHLRDMTDKVAVMMDLCLAAFKEQRGPDIDALMALEDDVDALRYSVWRETLTYMAQDPKNIEPCAHYMMVARYLERCGDNVCKMAEKIHYAATGERLLLH